MIFCFGVSGSGFGSFWASRLSSCALGLLALHMFVELIPLFLWSLGILGKWVPFSLSYRQIFVCIKTVVSLLLLLVLWYCLLQFSVLGVSYELFLQTEWVDCII